MNKKEPLPSMAYFCLTVVEAIGESRAKSAAKFNIDKQVLDELGGLSSTRGDITESRKSRKPNGGEYQPLTTKEIDWITAALRLIIRRVAEYNHAPEVNYPLIDLKMLPSLV